MPRKKAAPKRTTRRKETPVFFGGRWIVFFLISAVLTVLLAYFISKTSPVPCANSISCVSVQNGKYDATALTGEFMGQTVTAPLPPQDIAAAKVLGVAEANSKRIEIDLTNQRLHAFENNTEVFNFSISSGKYGKTPTGEFLIWIKLRYTRMQGGNKELGTYYNLPNVPHTMFFYNDKIPKWRGFGIHGAYWHNNFGHPMSHGCINMALGDVEQLYNWATPVSSGHTTYSTDENPGTRVIIYGTAPSV